MIKTPKFWNTNSWQSYVFLPFSFLFIIASFVRRLFAKPQKVKGKFVICVGNITVGGAGKTPVAIALCKELKKYHTVCFLTKGYRRNTKGFICMSNQMMPFQTGDEPRLLFEHAPVYLYSSAKEVFQNVFKIKQKVIIMDDGLQNLGIIKDFSILVIGENGFGNGKIFPSGPLREYPVKVMNSINYIICMTNKLKERFVIKSCFPIKHYHSSLEPQQVVAFSGIGNNTKFLQSLIEKGFDVIKFFEFPDHHFFSRKEIEEIVSYAKEFGVKIITTEKDYVRLSNEYKNKIHTLKMEVILDEKLINTIIQKMSN